MRLASSVFVFALAALALNACESATVPRCDVLPTRVVATSGDTVQTVSGLRYIDTQIGAGTEVRTCVQVEVAYVGTLLDGTRFDSGTLTLVPGGRMGFIAGFEQALIGMREGGTRRAILPPYLAYGDATLVFDLEILSVTE